MIDASSISSEELLKDLKAQGLFDKIRRDCTQTADTKPAYLNLSQRVDRQIDDYLSNLNYNPKVCNLNQHRERLRKRILDSSFFDVGVDRIVEQVIDEGLKKNMPVVTELIYKKLGFVKPKIEPPEIKKENGELTIKTELTTTDMDLEAVSPESDKKSESSDKKKDEEIIEDVEEFESPAFEPLEGLVKTENENSRASAVSGISGLTSQNSNDKTIKSEVKPEDNESQLSQVSSNSHFSGSGPNPVENVQSLNITEEAQMPKFNENSSSAEDKKEQEKNLSSNFDLKNEKYEFTGTERKSFSLEEDQDRANVPAIFEKKMSVDIDNLYANDTTNDSSENRMEIDLKDESLCQSNDPKKVENSQDTQKKSKNESSRDSSKITDKKPKSENSQDSPRSRDDKDKKNEKSSKSTDKSKERSSSSSSSKYKKKSSHSSSKNHSSSSSKVRSSSSSKPKTEESSGKSKTEESSGKPRTEESSGKSKTDSSRHKSSKESDRSKSSSSKDHHKSSSSREHDRRDRKDGDKNRDKDKERDKDKDRKSRHKSSSETSKSKESKSKNEEKPADDHHQEKITKRRPTNDDSNDGSKNLGKKNTEDITKPKPAESGAIKTEKSENTPQKGTNSPEDKEKLIDQMLVDGTEIRLDDLSDVQVDMAKDSSKSKESKKQEDSRKSEDQKSEGKSTETEKNLEENAVKSKEEKIPGKCAEEENSQVISGKSIAAQKDLEANEQKGEDGKIPENSPETQKENDENELKSKDQKKSPEAGINKEEPEAEKTSGETQENSAGKSPESGEKLTDNSTKSEIQKNPRKSPKAGEDLGDSKQSENQENPEKSLKDQKNSESSPKEQVSEAEKAPEKSTRTRKDLKEATQKLEDEKSAEKSLASVKEENTPKPENRKSSRARKSVKGNTKSAKKVPPKSEDVPETETSKDLSENYAESKKEAKSMEISTPSTSKRKSIGSTPQVPKKLKVADSPEKCEDLLGFNGIQETFAVSSSKMSQYERMMSEYGDLEEAPQSLAIDVKPEEPAPTPETPVTGSKRIRKPNNNYLSNDFYVNLNEAIDDDNENARCVNPPATKEAKENNYLGKSRHVGLPKPKKAAKATDLDSSKKEILKNQRYCDNDLYKPRLNLSQRRRRTEAEPEKIE